VDPTPAIRVSASEEVLCNGETIILTISNPNVPVSGSWVYDLDVTAESQISGASGDETGVTIASFTETLTIVPVAVRLFECSTGVKKTPLSV
jgi:hypothetical protein